MSALLFPGQGSQVVGMGSEFFANFNIVKKLDIGERIRDMIYYNDKLYLYLEDTASLAEISFN